MELSRHSEILLNTCLDWVGNGMIIRVVNGGNPPAEKSGLQCRRARGSQRIAETAEL